MKLGIAISVGILVLLGGLFYFMTSGVPDVITKTTNEAMLQKVELPSSLPSLYTSVEPGEDATPLYIKAVRLYERNARSFASGRGDESVKKEIAELVIDAMDCGKVSTPLLDDQIPWTTSPTPDFEGGLEGVLEVMSDRAQKQLDGNDQDGLLTTGRSMFCFGHRLFTHSQRLYNRRIGLGMMEFALSVLWEGAQWIEDGEAKLTQWNDALMAVRNNWGEKINIVHSVKPHIGDLVNIAKNDKDTTFRIAALLHLGIAKFNPGNVGNKKAIDAAIEEALQSTDPDIVKAAQGAKDFTKEELRKVR